MPQVTIGIPTFRRGALLRRAVASALAQSYPDVEVVVSDNCSNDDTASVGRELAASDARLRFLQQATNVGPTANLLAVLAAARGEYFMWLGDDDWIDPDYVQRCVELLEADPEVAVVGGVCHNYRSDRLIGTSKAMELVHEDPRRRVIDYYSNVEDNPIFYGVMRRSLISRCTLANTLGADWMLMAQVAFCGKVRTAADVRLHRERVGATSENVGQIVRNLGLPAIQQRLPVTTIALGAAWDVQARDDVFGALGVVERRALAASVAGLIVLRVGVWMPIRARAIRVLGQQRATRWRSTASRAWSRAHRILR